MKNIVLMAMSTLPKKLDSCDYFAENSFEKPLIKACVSQLEPVTRLCLQNTQDAADLIILGTEATLENDSLQGTDAVSFFLDRIAQTENGQEFQVDTDGAVTHDYQAFHLIGEHVTRRISAAVIKIDEDQLIIAIEKAVQLIRSIRAEDEISLWIAANGGLRESYSYISAIVSLLKYDGIKPSHILSTETNAHTIIDFSASFQMFDFVSGINEFKQFGSITTLKEYYKGHEDDPVILAMEKIADGTSQSNANLFTKGLDELRDLFLHEENHQDSFLLTNSPEFRIFKSNIIEDYSPLLESNDYCYLDIVERCSKKNQTLQALAFIESRMYLDYLKTGLLIIDEDDANTIRNIKALLEDSKRKDNVIHCAIDGLIFSSGQWSPSSVFSDQSSYNSYIDSIENGISFPVPFSAKIWINRFKKNGIGRFSVSFKEKGPSVGYYIGTCLSKDDPYTELIWLVFHMHRVLKQMRNDLFHGNEENQDEYLINCREYSFGELASICIKTYIRACRLLFNHVSSIPDKKKQSIRKELCYIASHEKAPKVTSKEKNAIGRIISVKPSKLSNSYSNLVGNYYVDPAIIRPCFIKIGQMEHSAAKELINKTLQAKIVSVAQDGFHCVLAEPQ